MAVTLKQLKKITPLASGGGLSVFTTPLSKDVLLTKNTITNISATVVIVQMYIVDKSGSASASNQFYKDFEVKVGRTRNLYELDGHILTAEQFIWVSMNVASANIMISGAELT